jgi:predicted nucleotidyltransferase
VKQSEYQHLVESLLRLTEDDTRIAALLVYGSHADDGADRFSDLDVGLVADDHAYEDVVAGAPQLVGGLGTPLFLSDFGKRGRLHAILAAGVGLELIIDRDSDLELGEPYRVLFDRGDVVGRALARRARASAPAVDLDDVRRRIDGFWHDVDHLVTALGRGNTWWAYGQLDELRRLCLDLARLEAGVPPEEEAYWKVDEALPPERLALLHATVAPPEIGPIQRAAWALLDLYRQVAIPLATSHAMPYPYELDRLLSSRLSALATA